MNGVVPDDSVVVSGSTVFMATGFVVIDFLVVFSVISCLVG